MILIDKNALNMAIDSPPYTLYNGEMRAKWFDECIENAPTIEAEPVKHGHWIIKDKTKLVPTGKLAVTEGYILNKTSSDKPFTIQEAHLIELKEHRVVRQPYCSECGSHGDDEWDMTLYCPNCGARMDGGEEDE